MARWIGLGALALVWATVAAGQTPAPAPTAVAGPRVGEVMTFRTSGQPERRVRVVRVIGTPDTDGLADVEDLGTGAKYSVPLKVVAMMARASFADAPAAAVPAAPTLKPGSASGLPAVAQTLPRVPPAAENGWPRDATPPTPVATKSRPAPTAAVPAVTLSRTQFDPPVPPPAPASRPAVTAEASAAEVTFRAVPPTVSVEADETRVVAASASRPAEPAAIRTPQVAIAPPEYVVVPVLEYTAPAAPPVPDRYGPPPVTPLAEPRPSNDAPVAAPLPPPVMVVPPSVAVALPPPVVVPPPPAPLPPPVVVPASRVVPAAPVEEAVRAQGVPAQMLEEVQPFVNDLFQALRPSSRERAATALAEGRYGARAEVKATLARAALTDPAPSVRAHCIAQLARLGYHESSYVGYLDACAESGHALVKQAATDALARLVSRN